MKIYVGNLSFDTTDSELSTAFAQHGDVQEATIITDRDTGRSRGFGFVQMGTDEAAREAIKAMNGTELSGRQLTVNEAKPRPERSGGGGGRRSGW